MKALIASLALLAAPVFFASPARAQDDFTAEQTRLLAEAEAALAQNPDDADAIIWKGRRLGYLGRYEEAIAAFEEGERRHPDDARFARHIGHRLISLRRFAEADAAFGRAARLSAAIRDEIEPDGLPNEAGVPTSTLKGNIWYHAGLAHYLQGNFGRAARAFSGAAALAHNTDAAAAARYWLYLALMRAGEPNVAERVIAAVDPDWSLIENGVYHELTLCFRDLADCDAILARARASEGVDYSTPAYGVAMKYLLEGKRKEARALFEEIAQSESGAAFGRLAAEAELARPRR